MIDTNRAFSCPQQKILDLRRRQFIALGTWGLCIGLLGGVLALAVTLAYTTGFSGADEPAHFLNGYFISIYLKEHFGVNPLAFATEFYIHYPKISIGHWPPAYYCLLGLLFLVVPPTMEAAVLTNLVVSSLPAAGVAIALGYLLGRRAGLIGVVVYSLMPLVVEGQSYFMLDQALTASCMFATITWVTYASRPGWQSALLFAGLCAFAALLKGNGWLLVFVPVYHMLLTRNWRLLALPHLYGAALAAALIVIPWYWLTTGIAADGFNYQAGWSYATAALYANLGHLAGNLGLLGVLLAVAAVFREYYARWVNPARWSVISACLSLVLATLTLQSIVPVDIVDRYMTPALPAVLVLAFVGLHSLHFLISSHGRGTSAIVVTVLLTASMLAPGVMHLIKRTPKPDYQMADVVSLLANAQPHEISLIDGNSNAEGAFIAEMAIHDSGLNHYAVRASKLFAETNFMGSKYQLKFVDPQSVLAEISRLGIKNIVVVRIGESLAFPHSEQLAEALRLPNSQFRKVATLVHGNRYGTTELYKSTAIVVPDIKAVRQLGIPAKASALNQSQLSEARHATLPAQSIQQQPQRLAP